MKATQKVTTKAMIKELTKLRDNSLSDKQHFENTLIGEVNRTPYQSTSENTEKSIKWYRLQILIERKFAERVNSLINQLQGELNK